MPFRLYCEFARTQLSDRERPVRIAALDGEACAVGPTEADSGWWLVSDRMSFEDLGAARIDGFATRAETIAIYEDASGREALDLDVLHAEVGRVASVSHAMRVRVAAQRSAARQGR